MEEVREGLVIKAAEQAEASKRYSAQLAAAKRINSAMREQIVANVLSGKAPDALKHQFQTEELIALFDNVIYKMNQHTETAWDDDYTVNYNEVIAMDYIESLLPKKQVATETNTHNISWATYSNDEDSLCNIDL